jgi:hypothetical protein
MRRTAFLASLALFTCAPAAFAAQPDAQLAIVIGEGDDKTEIVLPLPTGVTRIECEPEAIMNLHCLRTDASREAEIIDTFAKVITGKGWDLVGEDKKSRPYTVAFKRQQAKGACPSLISIISTLEAPKPQPPIPEGKVDILVVKTFDVTCMFDSVEP